MGDPVAIERLAIAAVEGHGEVGAAGNLLNRLAVHLGLPLRWAQPRRAIGLGQVDGMVRAASAYRHDDRCQALLLLRDADDVCPREMAPAIAERLRALQLPFPAAVVLLKPEYEVLFLPGLSRIAGQAIDGRPGIRAGSIWTGPWEGRRDVKGQLTARMPPGRAYKPTTDQLALTRMIDLDELAGADVPCFGTLTRAVRFLAEASAGDCYPALM